MVVCFLLALCHPVIIINLSSDQETLRLGHSGQALVAIGINLKGTDVADIPSEIKLQHCTRFKPCMLCAYLKRLLPFY